MDMWRYFELTHASHDIMNPLSSGQLEGLIARLELRAASRVLDLGCGHASFLLRAHSMYGAQCVGVDASPYAAARAKERVAEAGLTEAVEIVHAPGETYEVQAPFDVTVCLGATWIFGGYAGTLDALLVRTKPGGAIVVGEPYWLEPAPSAYLEAEGIKPGEFHDLGTCHALARDRGLGLVWMTRSTSESWDTYEMQQAAAVDAFARAHPLDPDLEALQALRDKYSRSFLEHGARCLGWAAWIFRAPVQKSERPFGSRGRAYVAEPEN